MTLNEVYQTIAYMIRDLVSEDWIRTNEIYAEQKVKQVYYFSIEFLIGRLLESNLLGIDMDDICRQGLEDLGWDLDKVIPAERDPGLGNGGLGRLAACFIDSLAALQLPGHGNSIRYQYGLFNQRIVDNQQVELPDNWLVNGYPWEVKKVDKAVYVRFGGNAYMRPDEDGSLECVHEKYSSVRAVPYDVPIIGYHNNTVNTLRLWRAEYSREQLYQELSLGDRRRAFRYKDSVQQISRFLYPDDSNEDGRRLRLMQEYFFVSAGLQSIVRHYKKKYHESIYKFDRYVAIHINDTHPALVIPELMRILMDEEGVSWDAAWNITVRTVAYTNHTILPEAMENGPSRCSRNCYRAFTSSSKKSTTAGSKKSAASIPAMNRGPATSPSSGMDRSTWPIWPSSAATASTVSPKSIRRSSRIRRCTSSIRASRTVSPIRPTAFPIAAGSSKPIRSWPRSSTKPSETAGAGRRRSSRTSCLCR